MPFVLLGLALVAALTIARSLPAASDDVKVEPLGDRMRRITVDGRSYLVIRLGSGDYSVVSVANPAVRLNLGQEGPPLAIGDEASIAQLKADMARFPPSLFDKPVTVAA